MNEQKLKEMNDIKECEHGNTFNCLQCEVKMLTYVIEELQDEVQLLTDKLYYAERARDGHYHKLQIAMKRIEQLEQMQPVMKKAAYLDLDDEV